MLSQIEVPAPRPRIDTTAEVVHVAISVKAVTPKVAFIVTTPGLGVDVDPKDPNVLIVHPGNYFLDFTILNDELKSPALLVPTDFGMAGLEPSGTSTATLFNNNALTKGDENRVLEFTFNFVSGLHDPTIVNTPDPA